MMRAVSMIFAVAFAALLAACAAEPRPAPETAVEGQAEPQAQSEIEPVLSAGETILGQPLAWPAGSPQVTAVIVTLPPGAETGWHSHPVPLFGWMLEGELTVTYAGAGDRV